jgi:ABC-type antimicrobial peptide transport system permease subunit
VVSYIVAQRTNEFGIRMALGAARSHVLQLVFASTSVSVGGGLAAGVVLSLALKGVLSRWAQGSAMDIVIVVAVAALLTAAATVACLVPAYRASAIDPATALRYE